jgi:glycosyltransferase involved in cell wall biosynthesis
MRLAFVLPRYGPEIASGPEHAGRLLAEQAAQRHQVDVLTTCARSDSTWKNDYPEVVDRLRGVLVRRFAVNQPHDHEALERAAAAALGATRTRGAELEWVRCLGPSSPGLHDYLRRNHRSYDALVFVSLWHHTTVHGLRVAPERSVLFPCLRLAPVLRFGLWADVLSWPRAVGFFSHAERRLVRSYVGIRPTRDEVVGVGVATPREQSYPRHQQDPADAVADGDEAPGDGGPSAEGAHLSGRGVPFRRRHRLYDPFALYGGRVEPDNGSEDMLEYFAGYADADGESGTPLLLMGVKMMQVPAGPLIRLAGVLPERDRTHAYEAADVTLAPSPDDPLALALLESLAVGTPVLASARNPVAVEHCRRSNGGLYYATRDEFVAAFRLLTTNAALRARLGENGRVYVRQHFRWNDVLGRFDRLISRDRV